ncbi:uncharacterized protein LOC134204063 [Armigeres subalbatus]|uniref:uncharacterized protein LOC134204063 n=1 Tax=Armigeres subalbatus TaxID=124917 RepID=UPI002ED289D0
MCYDSRGASLCDCTLNRCEILFNSGRKVIAFIIALILLIAILIAKSRPIAPYRYWFLLESVKTSQGKLAWEMVTDRSASNTKYYGRCFFQWITNIIGPEIGPHKKNSSSRKEVKCRYVSIGKAGIANDQSHTTSSSTAFISMKRRIVDAARDQIAMNQPNIIFDFKLLNGIKYNKTAIQADMKHLVEGKPNIRVASAHQVCRFNVRLKHSAYHQ